MMLCMSCQRGLYVMGRGGHRLPLRILQQAVAYFECSECPLCTERVQGGAVVTRVCVYRLGVAPPKCKRVTFASNQQPHLTRPRPAFGYPKVDIRSGQYRLGSRSCLDADCANYGLAGVHEPRSPGSELVECGTR